MKKVLGILFFLIAVLWLVGAATGVIRDDYPLVQWFGIFVTVGAGVFFFVLDRSDRVSPAKAYKMRSKLVVWYWVFFGSYVLLLAVSYAYGFLKAMSMYAASDAEKLLTKVIYAGPAFLLFVIFTAMIETYVIAFISAKSSLAGQNIMDYLDNGTFYPVGNSKLIFASDRALLFKKSMVVIPFANIAEVNNKRVLGMEQYIEIKLTNGNKIRLYSKEFNTLHSYLYGGQA
ncbi:MAG: hypothetical protein IJW18_08655 [Lachnospiraceae bacterium]|nr:hypothetical protein [Lachnospiraceae bacterium]